MAPSPLAQIERRVRDDGTTRSADVLSLHLGEPREARDASGTVVWRWDGDAFGANMGSTPAVNRDPDGDGVNTSVSLRFPGQYHDRESGLFYNHHRDYDPKLGRYIQSDPIGLAGGVNRYGYVSGDPVNFVDPTGLIASPMGGMYHKDAHDGIGGLYGPGGSMEDDYQLFSGWTMGMYGVTDMEFMAHPDGGHPFAEEIHNQIEENGSCTIRPTARGAVTIPPGYSPILQPSLSGSTFYSPYYMRNNFSGELALTPEWAIDSTEGAREFYTANGGPLLFVGSAATLAGRGIAVSGLSFGGGIAAGGSMAVVSTGAGIAGVVAFEAFEAGWINSESSNVNNSALGNCLLTTR